MGIILKGLTLVIKYPLPGIVCVLILCVLFDAMTPSEEKETENRQRK